jgi:hypothetical protein
MTEVDGRLYQKTLCEERQYLRDKRVKGKRDASKRWETFHANSLKYNDATDATQHQKTDAPTPTPTPTQERKKESIAQKSDSASDWPTDFEHQFWQAYPRKIGKQAAMRALARVKKTKAVPWASMLLAINKFSTWAASKETRFVKHPATWLNAGCWDDELEVNGGLFDGQATDAKDRNGQGVNGAFDTARRNGGQTRGDAILAGMGNIAARLARNGDGRRENVVLPDEGSAGINGGGADVSQAALRIA